MGVLGASAAGIGCGSDAVGSVAGAGAAGMGVGEAAGAATAGAMMTAGGSGGASAQGGAPPQAGAPAQGGSAGAMAGAASAGAGGTAGSSAAGASGSSGAAAISGSIVPLYTYPSDASWSALVNAKKAHPSAHVIAIVNPDSGPGSNADATFTTGIAQLLAANVVPIGYVRTNYTKQGEPAVKADIDHWYSFYPAIAGIFFDEQSAKVGDEPFYRDVSSYAKSKGASLTVGNPGTGVPDSYLDTVDILLCYESAGVPSLASLSKYAPHRTHFAIIPYAASFDASYVKSAASSVAYVYVTGDDLPNPWDTLPAFFGDLLGALTP